MSRETKFRAWDKVAKKYMKPWPDGFHILGETTCFDLIGMQLKDRNPEKTVLEMLNDVEIEQYTGREDGKLKKTPIQIRKKSGVKTTAARAV